MRTDIEEQLEGSVTSWKFLDQRTLRINKKTNLKVDDKGLMWTDLLQYIFNGELIKFGNWLALEWEEKERVKGNCG